MGVKQSLFICIVLSLLLFGCGQQGSAPKDNGIVPRIDAATAAGIRYLSTAYDGKTYRDSYLAFVYPGEAIACPLESGCNITYRLLDAYFDVIFLEQTGVDMTPIKSQEGDANKILSALAKKWEDEKIDNVRKSTGSGGVALDTYCILGYVEKDKTMAKTAASYLDENDDWMPSNRYTQDVWRNIADESWCLRLFIAAEYDKEVTRRLVAKLINDTDTFKLDQNITDQDKLAAIYHTLYVLTDYEKATGDRQFHQKKMEYADFISYFSYKKLAGNTLMTANLLDVMVYAGYDNPAAVRELADQVLLQQEENGMWRMSPDASPDNVQVFTTFRALIGLNQYKKSLAPKGLP